MPSTFDKYFRPLNNRMLKSNECPVGIRTAELCIQRQLQPTNFATADTIIFLTNEPTHRM